MDFRSVHNYYEHLVIEYMRDIVQADYDEDNSDFLLDVACYALSRLPARYIRHEIDMAFYLDPEERRQMEAAVKKEVDNALVYIGENFNKDDRYETATIAEDNDEERL